MFFVLIEVCELRQDVRGYETRYETRYPRAGGCTTTMPVSQITHWRTLLNATTENSRGRVKKSRIIEVKIGEIVKSRSVKSTCEILEDSCKLDKS